MRKGCDILRMKAICEYLEEKIMKKLTLAGCIFWIAGLVVFIVGINLTGNTREQMMTLGSIIFMIGLGLYAVVWLKRKNDENK